MTSSRCGALRADGSPCRAWAVHGSDPPRCAAHGGTESQFGAPEGNENALKHGHYAAWASQPPPEEWTIETVILDLCIKQARLSQYIDARREDLTADELARFLRIHGMNASRLGRLLRDKDALTGHTSDGMNEIIAQALKELNEEWGTDL